MPKLYIFDLDATLWDGKKLYPDVDKILKKLKEEGHYIYIASYNLYAPKILKKLKIVKYFDGGPHGIGATKYGMIKEIKEVLNNKKRCYDSIEFYDDLHDNIYEVSTKDSTIRAVHIVDGLQWKHI